MAVSLSPKIKTQAQLRDKGLLSWCLIRIFRVHHFAKVGHTEMHTHKIDRVYNFIDLAISISKKNVSMRGLNG